MRYRDASLYGRALPRTFQHLFKAFLVRNLMMTHPKLGLVKIGDGFAFLSRADQITDVATEVEILEAERPGDGIDLVSSA